MSDLHHLLAHVPATATQAIAIYPDTDGLHACRWVGMTAEQATSVLYQMADAIVAQKIKPDPRWDGTPPAR